MLRGAGFVTGLVNLVVSVAEALLGLRIILKLLAANPAAPFVQWVYETSEPLITPFRGMFPSPVTETGSVFEFSSLFALMIYALLGYLLVELVALVESGGKKKKK